MSKAEIRKQFDAIVEFAGVEKFLDTPVKRYSSGMYVRLAFAVAAHLRTEILIVDEVLSVGDLEFQKKCLGKMQDVSSDGRTVLFVSHNMAAIQTLCHRCVMLQAGKIVCDGKVHIAIAEYANQIKCGQIWNLTHEQSSALAFTQISGILRGQQPTIVLELHLSLQSISAHASAYVAVDISDSTGAALMQAVPRFTGFISDRKRHHRLKLEVQLPPLIPGRYIASLWAGPHNSETLDQVKECVSFEILDSPSPGRAYPHTHDHGHIVPASAVKVVDELIHEVSLSR
jgi:lipopolysaccharide transport system ATP-binding protein